jgi:Sel1 repeat/TIR domain
MTGTIFVNYRREDSISTAGRLYDRFSHTFGRKNIFMDVDRIPAGVDFEAHLNSQIAACEIALVVIGPRWLEVKDESGGRRLDNPDDFVTIEIATLLARNIRVIPVLVDGARMPKAGELPDPLKALARRQAVEVRQLHFGRDADALVERVNEALKGELGRQSPWRGKAIAGAAAAVLLLLGWIGLSSIDLAVWRLRQPAQPITSQLAPPVSSARKDYEKAAAKGDASAMFNLGVLYHNGQGVAQDYVKAREWYEKAAAKGEASAMFNLGVLYDNGFGVAQDYAKARAWYEKAAAKGQASAMFNLGLLYHNGHGVAQDYTMARGWFGKAADEGNASAMFNLGVFYDEGFGVAQDYAKAREWYEKAAARGHPRARAHLEQMPIR